MKKSVKTLAFLTIILFHAGWSAGQLKLPGISNGLAGDIKKVVADYPNRFTNLMGEVLVQHSQSTDYACNFQVQGTEESFITRYSGNKEVSSWQTIVLRTDNFDKAAQKFKTIFNQLNNLSVNPGNGNNRLKGVYEAPAESKKFTSILFALDPAGEAVKKLKIEIALQYIEPMEWKLSVLVYDREREDEERGNIRE